MMDLESNADNHSILVRKVQETFKYSNAVGKIVLTYFMFPYEQGDFK